MATKLVDLSTLSEKDVERFWRKVRPGDNPDECWEWRGYRHAHSGYGYTLAVGNSRPAHRVSYVIKHGAIPTGLVLDHLCRNRGCVHPDHLEAVTNAENLRRGLRGQLTTTCPQGHAYDDTSIGYRRCMTCHRATARRYGARRRARAKS